MTLTLVIFNSKHNEALIQEDQISSDSYTNAPAVECEKPKNFFIHYQSERNWNCRTCILENIWTEPFLVIYGNVTTHQQ